MHRYYVAKVLSPAIAVLAMAVLSGCSPSASGPSQADIRSVLNQMVAETKAAGSRHGVPDVSPAVTLDSFTMKGTSIEGATAKVLITATVTYVPAVNQTDHYIQSPMHFGSGDRLRGAYSVTTQRTNLLDVNLYFRKFDTGWRLERYE